MSLSWKAIRKAAREQGWREEQVKKGIRLVPPDLSKQIVVLHRTPSDRRALANTLAQMRRSGFVWPWPPKERKKR